jgi:hypothetical protein
MSSPQAEAIGIFKRTLDDLFIGKADLKNLLRSCAHACQLLGWREQLSWFENELRGYSSEAELPWYRKDIIGYTYWRACGGIYAAMDRVIDDAFARYEEATTHTTIDVRAGIDWVLLAAQSGYAEPTGKKKKSSKYLKSRREDVETEEVSMYDKQVFQTILGRIENSVFDFASKSYSVLRYGDTLRDVWQAYRTRVDEALIAIGLWGHLETIRAGLNSDNPQDWRTAMWSCRDILHDLAAYLWRDPRETYQHLPGRGKGGKLGVTDSDYVNRLGAYLHCKGTAGETGAYIRAEMERIYHSIDTLNDLDSKAHSAVTLSDVRIAAIGTYTILGEMVMRTDMKPVMNYDCP